MTDHELFRFTPRELSAKQVATLLAVVQDWHGVHVDIVGDGQVGIVGPNQRHDIIRQAKGDSNGYV